MAKTKKRKKTLVDEMPSAEVLAEGRQIVAELMKYLGKHNLFLMFDPDSYKLRLGPDGVAFVFEGDSKPENKIPYTQEEDGVWEDKFSLDVEWSEFDPDNFDDEAEEDEED